MPPEVAALPPSCDTPPTRPRLTADGRAQAPVETIPRFCKDKKAVKALQTVPEWDAVFSISGARRRPRCYVFVV